MANEVFQKILKQLIDTSEATIVDLNLKGNRKFLVSVLANLCDMLIWKTEVPVLH